MRVRIDTTPLLHGERTVQRNSRNLLKALVNHEEIDWRLLYFDRKGNTPGRPGMWKKRYADGQCAFCCPHGDTFQGLRWNPLWEVLIFFMLPISIFRLLKKLKF